MGGVVKVFEQWGVIWTTLGAFATFLAVLGFGRWGWPVVRGFFQRIGRFFSGMSVLADLPEFMPALGRIHGIESTLSNILKEVLPNGGGSLRDAVNRTDVSSQRTEVALTLFINTTRAQWDGMGMFGVSEFSPAGELVYANNTLLKWVNRTESEVSGAGWINAVSLRDRERVRSEWQSCVEDRREFFGRCYLIRPDGDEFEVQTTRTPVSQFPGGPVIKWVGITQRIQARTHA